MVLKTVANFGSTGGGGGGVSSVTATSPVASSGGATPDISLNAGYGDTQNPYAGKTANYFLAAPNGSGGVPTFRAIVAADIPALTYQAPITLTTTGTSGAATFVGNTLNIPQYSGGGGSSTITISNKTSAYTVVSGDLGYVINCTTGTFTVSLTAASSLGTGFNCWIWNTSSTSTNVITIDPNGAETIDGLTSISLRMGEGTQIICDGTNWQTGDKKTMRAYSENLAPTNTRPIASGNGAIALGISSTASNTYAFSYGFFAVAGGQETISTTRCNAGSDYSTAIGQSSSQAGAITVTGAGAMALGGSRASGVDSFAASISNNTASYGAAGANSIAIGNLSYASASRSIAIGGLSATASATNAMALGNSDATADSAISICASSGGYKGTASAVGAIAIGYGRVAASKPVASGQGAVALQHGNALQVGKLAFGYDAVGWLGQYGLMTLRAETTSASATVLTSNASAADSTNQIVLPNNSAYAFSGTIIARQQAAGGSDYAAWEIKGAIIRGSSIASTVIGTYNINVLSKTAGASAWDIALTASTTYGSLTVTATGAASTNIRWVASVQTSEVTYA